MTNPTQDAQYYRDQRKAETRNVKAALQSAGFTAKVGHGRGTSYAWLEITIVGQKFSEESYKRVIEIATSSSGRSKYSAEHISVYFTKPVENLPFNESACGGSFDGFTVTSDSDGGL